MKTTTLLGLLELKIKEMNQAIVNTTTKFSNTKLYEGFDKNHQPADGYLADPQYIGHSEVKAIAIDDLKNVVKCINDALNLQFRLEATNGTDEKVEFEFDGKKYKATALDLMRINSIFGSQSFQTLINSIPVLDNEHVWKKMANSEMYEAEPFGSDTRTTEKETVILKDPNIDPLHLPSNYRAETETRSKVVITGHYTVQWFSGAMAKSDKVAIVKKYKNFMEVIHVALKEANDKETKNPNVDISDVLNSIFF